MQWIYDNLVWLAFVIGLAAIVAGLVAMAVAGLRLWRVGRAAASNAGRAGEALSADVARLQASLDALPQRQEQLQAEISDLQGRVDALSVLAGAAGDLANAVRAPGRREAKR